MKFEIQVDPPTQMAIDERKASLQRKADNLRKQENISTLIIIVLATVVSAAIVLSFHELLDIEVNGLYMFALTLFGAVIIVALYSEVAGDKYRLKQADIKNECRQLETLSPDKDYEKWIELIRWRDHDEDIARYLRQVAGQERLPVIGEHLTAQVWMMLMEKQHRRAEARAACESFKRDTG